jgi:hypothetical protein
VGSDDPTIQADREDVARRVAERARGGGARDGADNGDTPDVFRPRNRELPQIAARLFLSPGTASNHVANVLGKLGAANRRAAVAAALRLGLA